MTKAQISQYIAPIDWRDDDRSSIAFINSATDGVGIMLYVNCNHDESAWYYTYGANNRGRKCASREEGKAKIQAMYNKMVLSFFKFKP